MHAPPAQPTLAERLQGVVATVRGELDISRHVFRAGASYVIRDPVTFATHRFDPEDYQVLSALRTERTLGETFNHLVSAGALEHEDEQDFYAFILDLHQRSLLSLPINDADALYRRYERRQRAQRLSKILGVFFMRVPVGNPNALLTRTLPVFGWLFTKPALFAWLLLTLAAGFVALTRWDELATPMQTVIQGNNAFMLIAALIGLKIVHEFGHAYACRAFGGHVPEMGVYLVLFTPLAYVDATDSWTFTRTRRRAVVTLAGVYFESIIGACAVFVWAWTEASTLHTLAYQVILLSTVTTLLFNLNPLLRYDAYYLVSDLVGIPNLRARCQESVIALLKRLAYGLRRTPEGEPIRPHAGLAAFGLAQCGYRVLIMTTLVTVLTMKFGSLGIVLAIVLIGLTLNRLVTSLVRYLANSAELAGRRLRAIAATCTIATLAALAIAAVPLPWPIAARGVVSFETVETVRAPVQATLVALPVRLGQTTRTGDALALLESEWLETEVETLTAELQAERARASRAAARSPGEGALAAAAVREASARLDRVQEQAASLRIAAPADGRVLELATRSTGIALNPGDPIAVFGAGVPEAVFHIREFEFESLGLSLGDEVICRAPAHPEREITGHVAHIGRVGARDIERRIATGAPQGLVPLNAATGRAADPYFEVRVRLDHTDAELAGTQLVARFPSHARTTAQVIDRGVRRFINHMQEGAGG